MLAFTRFEQLEANRGDVISCGHLSYFCLQTIQQKLNKWLGKTNQSLTEIPYRYCIPFVSSIS